MDVDKVQNIVTYTAGAVAVFSLIGALFQSMSKGNGSATPTLVVFLAACVVVFLPLVSQFSLPGFEARMNNKVSEVKAIEDTIRKVATVNARVTYLSIAWANRLDVPTMKDRQLLLDEVDQQLRDFKVSDEERQRIVQPLVQMMKYDLYDAFRTTIMTYAEMRYTVLVEKARDQNPQAVALRDKHSEGISAYSERLRQTTVFKRIATFNLSDEIDLATPTEWVNATEAGIVNELKARILRMANEGVSKGGYASDAIDFLDDLRTDEGKIRVRQLFARALDQLGR